MSDRIHVPSNWNVARIGALCETASGGTPSRAIPAFWNGDIPWVKTGEINYRPICDTVEKITPLGESSSAARKLPKGTVVMALFGQGLTRGRVAMLGIDACVNQACLGLLAGLNINNEFLFHVLTSKYEDLRRLSNDGAQQNLNSSLVRDFPILVPSSVEQRKIARILTTLDNLIERTESLIAKYQAVKQGLMHDFFTRGVDADGKLRPPQAEAPDLYKQSELGWIPKEWEAKSLKNVAMVRYGIGDPLDRALEEGVNILSLPNVNITGDFVLDDVPKVERRKVLASDFLQHGDLLFNWRNGSREHLGKTAYFDLPGEWTHVGFLLKVAADCSQCQPLYLFYEITFRRATGFFLTSKSQVNNTFNASELEEMVVRVPVSLDEQKKIASRLSSLDSQMNAERRYLRNLAVLKSGLMQDLLTGKVRVKVDEEKAANV